MLVENVSNVIKENQPCQFDESNSILNQIKFISRMNIWASQVGLA